MPLGETAEVDAHALAGEAQAARSGVELQPLPADELARCGQRPGIGPHPRAVVVELADGGVADVEGAAGEARERQRTLDEPAHFLGQRHCAASGLAVDP